MAYLYLLRSNDGFYKIGWSRNWEQRVAEINAFLPVPVAVECVWDLAHMAYPVEQALHRHFQLYRARGEWFDLGPEDRAWLLLHTARAAQIVFPGHTQRAIHTIQSQWKEGGTFTIECPLVAQRVG